MAPMFRYDLCEQPGCYRLAPWGTLCKRHNLLRMASAIGAAMLAAAGFFLILSALLSMSGCASPPRKTLVRLLSQCREANRARARIIAAYPEHCPVLPAQNFSELNFGEAGQ